jgi:magnesium transporter
MNRPQETTSQKHPLSPEQLTEAWAVMSGEERIKAFGLLTSSERAELFTRLDAAAQAALVLSLPTADSRFWFRSLKPDDAVDTIQAAPAERRDQLLALLDDRLRMEVTALLAYAEDDAGGLMSPRYARLRPEMKVDEAIAYLRIQARDRLETVYYVYVLDAEQHLLGVVSFRELFAAPPDRIIREIMRPVKVTAREEMDQEDLGRLFKAHGFLAIPVVDDQNRLKGIVTIDDIVHVVEEEATEDIQKLGAVETLGEPYLQVGVARMIRKRAGWLTVLFLGEMLTASAMANFEEEIGRAVVLALFVPLIVSSGGNSGSQATTLVIRAMALGELRMNDWWKVVRREAIAGLGLGLILGTIGLARIIVWQWAFGIYGEHYFLLAITVAFSLVGVVLWGTLSGSALPLLLRSMGFDPASSSAPFVATLVDVTGLVIYFTFARFLLSGTLL